MDLLAKLSIRVKAYQAAYILTNGATVDIIKRFDESYYSLFELDDDGLLIYEKEIDRAYNEMKELYGIIADDDTLIEYASGAFLAGAGKSMMLPKYFINTMFTNYARTFSGYTYLPEHALIAIDPGIVRTKQGEIEVFQIEATLFEDMCALYNEFVKSKYVENDKIQNKKKMAMLRSAFISGYNLLESYLNGIAFDYYFNNKESLLPEIKEKLIERKNDGSIKYLSLRDKIINYPRIILNKCHPIFDESNCREVKIIIDYSKNYRDSIVHPSPYVAEIEGTPKKLARVYALDDILLKELIVSVIVLIKRIDKEIYPDHSRVSWIRPLNEDGRFDDSVFI